MVPFDEIAGFTGPMPGRENVTLQVVAAAFRGRPVSFQIVAPWSQPVRDAARPLTLRQRVNRVVFALGVLSVAAAAAWFARRNARLGRGDRRGAARIASAVFVLGFFGILLKSHQVKKMISSYVGDNKEFERQYLSGELEVELIPQGTLVERIRAAGAGIGGFFTPTGYGTVVSEGKETRIIEGKPYVLEKPLHADFALVRAWKGDRFGNLVYRRTARNFNPVMATAARVTIAEVENLVDVGTIDPNHVVTPGVFVKHILHGERYERPIEKRTVRA